MYRILLPLSIVLFAMLIVGVSITKAQSLCVSAGIGVQHRCGPGCPGNCGCGCGTHDLSPQRTLAAQPLPKGSSVPLSPKGTLDDRAVLIYFRSDGCLACRQVAIDFKNNAYSRTLNLRYKVKTVTIKDDADMEKYNLKALPTFRISEPAVCSDIVGYKGPASLLSALILVASDPPTLIPSPQREPLPLSNLAPPYQLAVNGKDGRDGQDGKDTEIDYDRIIDAVTKALMEQLPKPVTPAIDYDQIVSTVIARMPKQKIYYDVRPVPVP